MKTLDQRWDSLRSASEKAMAKQRYENAEKALISALEVAEEFEDTDKRLAYTLEKLSECYWHLRKLNVATVYCKRVLKIYTRVLGEDHIDVSAVAGNLAMVYHAREMYPEAETYYLKAIEIKKGTLGNDHSEVTKLRSHLADVLRLTDRSKEADKLKTGASAVTTDNWKKTTGAHAIYKPPSSRNVLSEAEEKAKKIIDENMPKTLKGGKQNEAEAEDDNSKAEPAKRPKGAPPPMPAKKNKGLSKEDAAAKWNGFKEMAEKALADGDLKECEAIWHNGLDLAGTFGPMDPKLSYTLESLADVKFRLENYKMADGYYKRAYEIKLKALGPMHIAIAASANNLARLYYKMSEFDQAEEFAKKCVKIYETLLGSDNANVACSLHNLATLYHVQRKYKEAEPHYKKALDIKKKIFGPEHPETTRLIKSYAELLRKTNRGHEADNLDAAAIGLISGTWKTFQIQETQSLASSEDKCDICAAKLNGASKCPQCGFEVSIGVI